METIYNINVNDARTYILPIINIIRRRLNRISTLTNKLISLVAKLYTIPDHEDKTEVCDAISNLISEIEVLVLKNVDDAQIMEYALAEFTIKSTVTEKLQPISVSSEQHTYFA